MVCWLVSSLHSHPLVSLGWSGVVVSSAWTLRLLPAETHRLSCLLKQDDCFLFSHATKQSYYRNTIYHNTSTQSHNSLFIMRIMDESD